MNEINDLRSALAFLRTQSGQLVETDVEADPEAEISGIYRYVGAGGTVQRPTREDGPAMLFHNVKGFPGSSVVTGVLASRWSWQSAFPYRKPVLRGRSMSLREN